MLFFLPGQHTTFFPSGEEACIARSAASDETFDSACPDMIDHRKDH